MTHHVLDMPIDEAQARALQVGDTVTLEKHAVRHPRRHPDRDVRPRPHHALRPEGPRGDPHRAERAQGRSAARQFVRLRAAVHRHHDLDAHGALHAAADGARRRAPHHRQGRHGAGARSTPSASSAAPISPSSAAPRRWRRPGSRRSRTSTSTTCNPESLWKFRIKGFGPLLVTMDSHGGSLHAQVNADAAARRAAVLASIGSAHERADARDRHPDPRRRRRRAVRGAARQEGQPRSRRHHRGQGPARQMRLHAHGAGRLQRRAVAGRFGRAPFHGHDRGRRLAQRPGPRLAAGRRRRRSASASWRTSSAASSTAIPTAPCIRRPSPGRPSTAPCTRAT